MQWLKILKSHKFLIFVFVALFLLTRLPRLYNDEINPDAVNWHYRSEQFVVGLKTQLFEKTYQHYHPGVTLMWIVGVPIEVYKQITNQPIYTHENFVQFHFVAKVSLIAFQLFLSLVVLWSLQKTSHFPKAYLAVLLLSSEPFWLGNSRLLHLDILFTLLVFISLLTSYLYLQEKKWIYIVLSGISIALSFLTRSIGVGVFLHVLFFGMLFAYWWPKKDLKLAPKYAMILTLVFVLITFLFFPALWKAPVSTIIDIFSEGERIGLRKGHEQLFFGSETQDPGFFFYPLVLLLKLSPFLLLGIFGYLFRIYRISVGREPKSEIKAFGADSRVGLITYLGIFYLGYFVVMALSSKKLDRYMLTLYPFLALLSAYGYYYLYGYFANIKKLKIFLSYVVVAAMLFVVVPTIFLFPYYFTYTSPVFINAVNANKIIGQKPFGIGIFDLKKELLRKYAIDAKNSDAYPTLGFIDVKPIEEIYPNSKVFDIREYGPSNYDLVVLAVNEELPVKLTSSDYSFVKAFSVYINGLEYWKVYETVHK